MSAKGGTGCSGAALTGSSARLWRPSTWVTVHGCPAADIGCRMQNPIRLR
jgi:hypothetical protein